jgi:hypothetical protein
MATIQERLKEILPRIQEEGFFEGRKLGNELNFYVFDYNPQDELLVRDYTQLIKRQLEKSHHEHPILEINLYDAVIDILEQKGFLDKNFEFELKKGSEDVYNKTRRALKISQPNDLMVAYITDRVQPNQIVFLTGIGQIYPILRSHNVLNRLHAALDKNPLVLFFPGTYDGQSLSLFNLIKDDNYYRAFRLVE